MRFVCQGRHGPDFIGGQAHIPQMMQILENGIGVLLRPLARQIVFTTELHGDPMAGQRDIRIGKNLLQHHPRNRHHFIKRPGLRVFTDDLAL